MVPVLALTRPPADLICVVCFIVPNALILRRFLIPSNLIDDKVGGHPKIVQAPTPGPHVGSLSEAQNHQHANAPPSNIQSSNAIALDKGEESLLRTFLASDKHPTTPNCTYNIYPHETTSAHRLHLAKLEVMSGSYSRQETGHRSPGQVHHGQGAGKESQVSHAASPLALHISEEDQVRDSPDGHSAIQAEGLQAPRQDNQYQYQTHQGHLVDTNWNQRTIDSSGRQERGDGLWDHPAMIEAGFATPERVRGGRNRQCVSTEERKVDEEQGDRAEPGFLDMLGPRIKSLFRCGSRKQSQRVPRQMSAGLHTQRVDEEHHGARMTVRGIVPPPDSFRNAYQPQLGDRTEHGVLQTPAASDAGSRAREGRLPSSSTNQDASPMSDVRAAMSRSETIHISGGIFIDISIHI
ncbi:hypothetical protein BKA70DRAFT_1231154 [Coprinopsis sp. MPI-PUGE-AT-0042]|nr:hypothetical protein BKA70DRAFT_1231154 [Coprinopsis sp. MPI-PUGE-AT-0042]